VVAAVTTIGSLVPTARAQAVHSPSASLGATLFRAQSHGPSSQDASDENRSKKRTAAESTRRRNARPTFARRKIDPGLLAEIDLAQNKLDRAWDEIERAEEEVDAREEKSPRNEHRSRQGQPGSLRVDRKADRDEEEEENLDSTREREEQKPPPRAKPGVKVKIDKRGRALVELRAEPSYMLERRLHVLRSTVLSSSAPDRSVVAWIPLLKLEELAKLPTIHSIRPATEPISAR